MSLAGNHQHIVGLQLGYPVPYRLGSIADFSRVRAAIHNLPPDGRGSLTPRVIIGYNRHVGQILGDLSHHGPLARIPVAATAEDHK